MGGMAQCWEEKSLEEEQVVREGKVLAYRFVQPSHAFVRHEELTYGKLLEQVRPGNIFDLRLEITKGSHR
jgi:hypothetical protein